MTTQQLRYVSLFSDLNDLQLEQILKSCSRKMFQKNHMIAFEDEQDSRLYVILQGSVKLTRISEDGRECILAFLGPGDFFGELSLVENEYRSTNVTTIMETDLLYLRGSDFNRLVQRIPQITINLLREMALKLRQRDAQIKSLSMQNATGKVASTLLRLADDGGKIRMGHVEIHNLPPHRDIANMVGTSRETISRAIKWLSQKGYITKERGRLIIHDYEDFRAAFI